MKSQELILPACFASKTPAPCPDYNTEVSKPFFFSKGMLSETTLEPGIKSGDLRPLIFTLKTHSERGPTADLETTGPVSLVDVGLQKSNKEVSHRRM